MILCAKVTGRIHLVIKLKYTKTLKDHQLHIISVAAPTIYILLRATSAPITAPELAHSVPTL